MAAGLMGFDPELEAGRESDSWGRWWRVASPRASALEILIGDEMARKLGAAPGDELVVVVPAADGSMGNDLYTVCGCVQHRAPRDLTRSRQWSRSTCYRISSCWIAQS